jgi:hypothetical protein
MKNVIAFWNQDPSSEKYKTGQLIGTVTIEDSKVSVSPEGNGYLQSTVYGRSPEWLLGYYSNWANSAGVISRLLGEGEKPTDLSFTKYEVWRNVSGQGVQMTESGTINDKGLRNRDAKKS